MYYKQVIV